MRGLLIELSIHHIHQNTKSHTVSRVNCQSVCVFRVIGENRSWELKEVGLRKVALDILENVISIE